MGSKKVNESCAKVGLTLNTRSTWGRLPACHVHHRRLEAYATFARNKRARKLPESTIPVLRLAILVFLITSSTVFGSTIVRCKYSVRDVAFVNVHGKSWQLLLIKPDNIDARTFTQWNDSLRTKLGRSNVGYVWFEPDSDDAKRLAFFAPAENDLPLMGLLGHNATWIPVSSQPKLTLDEMLDAILNSPAREETLSRVVDSLCVFVLVESGDENRDAEARVTVNAAIERLSKQMWTLEKPADKGPALVTISKTEQAEEAWLLQSFGIDQPTLPAVAIVYGQGRRLGEVLVGEDINLNKLVGRASLCGQDCECDLDREWLYGAQMIHVWSKHRERLAESSLSFDPNSAFVIAEVAQIMQKNAGQKSGQQRVDLGGGLIIHDLDPVANVKELQTEVANETASDQTADGKLENERVAQAEQTGQPHLPEAMADTEPGVSIPWSLLIGLAAVTLIVFLFKLRS